MKNYKQAGPTSSNFPADKRSITSPIYKGTTKVPAELNNKNTTPKKNKQDSDLAYRSTYLKEAFFYSYVRSGWTGAFFLVSVCWDVPLSIKLSWEDSARFVDVSADKFVCRCI